MNSKEGESLSVQQILMPPETDFLSSFYEAAQARELYTSSQCIMYYYDIKMSGALK